MPASAQAIDSKELKRRAYIGIARPDAAAVAANPYGVAGCIAVSLAHEARHIINGPKRDSGGMSIAEDEADALINGTAAAMAALGFDQMSINSVKYFADRLLADPDLDNAVFMVGGELSDDAKTNALQPFGLAVGFISSKLNVPVTSLVYATSVKRMAPNGSSAMDFTFNEGQANGAQVNITVNSDNSVIFQGTTFPAADAEPLGLMPKTKLSRQYNVLQNVAAAAVAAAVGIAGIGLLSFGILFGIAPALAGIAAVIALTVQVRTAKAAKKAVRKDYKTIPETIKDVPAISLPENFALLGRAAQESFVLSKLPKLRGNAAAIDRAIQLFAGLSANGAKTIILTNTLGENTHANTDPTTKTVQVASWMIDGNTTPEFDALMAEHLPMIISHEGLRLQGYGTLQHILEM